MSTWYDRGGNVYAKFNAPKWLHDCMLSVELKWQTKKQVQSPGGGCKVGWYQTINLPIYLFVLDNRCVVTRPILNQWLCEICCDATDHHFFVWSIREQHLPNEIAGHSLLSTDIQYRLTITKYMYLQTHLFKTLVAKMKQSNQIFLLMHYIFLKIKFSSLLF